VGARELDRVRRIALAFPEVTERTSHGEPCFFVRQKRPLCYFHDDHNGDGRISLWCPVPPGVQEEMASAEPARFFAPPTSSSGVFRQWLGVYLDSGTHKVDWAEITAILEDAYRHVAPAQFVKELDQRQTDRKIRP
jgi:hypothetical protein